MKVTHKKKLIISFDYELFFGDRSGTVENTLINTTNKILDALDKCHLKGNFFVDYLMFKYLEQNIDERSKRDLSMLKWQIHDIIKRGHRIELHLHPHWIDAKYNNDGTWNYSNYSHYMLSSFTKDEIWQMFKEGTEYLTRLAREVDPTYKIVAFRAGGWAIQPFDKLKYAFLDNDIRIDSSLSYGSYNLKVNQYYDFRNMPFKPYYRFEDDVCKEDENGQFIEVPISSYHRTIWNMICDKVYKILGLSKNMADGTHCRSNDQNKEIHKRTLKEKLSKNIRNMMTFSQTSTPSMFLAFLSQKEGLLCVIDHPKDFSITTVPTLEMMSKLCEGITYMDVVKILEGDKNYE